MKTTTNKKLLAWTSPLVDFTVTILLWSYFTLGFVLFFSFLYINACFFSKNREVHFQKLNSKFYRGLFSVLHWLAPLHQWKIDDEVKNIKSSVIICNHLSYLDPLILISLFDKHTTIVKTDLFSIPLFGRVLYWSGYISETMKGRFSKSMAQRIENLGAFLESGGNLFVFPEGTRSRDGNLSPFNKGAFKIAKLCRAPIKVLFIQNTDILFPPGKFLFNTMVPNQLSVELLESMEPDYAGDSFSVSKLVDHVRNLYKTRLKKP